MKHVEQVTFNHEMTCIICVNNLNLFACYLFLLLFCSLIRWNCFSYLPLVVFFLKLVAPLFSSTMKLVASDYHDAVLIGSTMLLFRDHDSSVNVVTSSSKTEAVVPLSIVFMSRYVHLLILITNRPCRSSIFVERLFFLLCSFECDRGSM